MNLLLSALKPHGIGVRPLDDNDFYRICEEQNITVKFWNERISFYLSVPEIDLNAIVLPNRLFGIQLHFAMFHELGHHFAHAGTDPYVAFDTRAHSKDEAEANAVALMALFPTVHHLDHIPQTTRFTRRLASDRLALFFLFHQ